MPRNLPLDPGVVAQPSEGPQVIHVTTETGPGSNQPILSPRLAERAELLNGMPVPRGLLSATKLWHSTSTQTLKSDSVCEATFLLGSPAAPLRGALKTVGNSLAAPASGGAWRDLHKR